MLDFLMRILSGRLLRTVFELMRERWKDDPIKFERFQLDFLVTLAKQLGEEPQAFYDLVVLNRRSYRGRP